jgi:hypothetical protein
MTSNTSASGDRCSFKLIYFLKLILLISVLQQILSSNNDGASNKMPIQNRQATPSIMVKHFQISKSRNLII